MFYFGYWTYLFILPGLILGIYAQAKVNSTFSKYSREYSSFGYTASEVAKILLDENEIYDVGIRRIEGNLTDNFNPTTSTVNLSTSTHDSNSIAAIGVAAHEIGHVIQHKSDYLPIKIRSLLIPVVNFGTKASIPIFILGLIIDAFFANGSMLGNFMLNLSVMLYGLSTVFALITLPVEINASNRAKESLLKYGILTQNECNDAAKVLDAAALTYIAAFVTSLLYFLRFLFIVSSFRGRRK